MNRPNQYNRPTADEWYRLIVLTRPTADEWNRLVALTHPKSPKPRKPTPENKRPRPEKFPRIRKHPGRTASVIQMSAIVIIPLILALVYVWSNLTAQEPASSGNHARLPSDSPTNQPTTHPPDTPAPFPYPTVPSIPNPTAAPTATRSLPVPTPTRRLWKNIYIEAFASCADKYQGEKKSSRMYAARTTIEQGLRTPEELRVIVEEKCPGAITAILQQPQQEVSQGVLAEPAANPADPIIEAFASCNGTYDENEKEERRREAQSYLDEGRRTLAELKAEIADMCPGADVQPLLNEFAQPPYEVQKAFEDGTLQPSHEYELAACHINPHNDSDDRQWLLFSDETEQIDGPVFAVYFEDGLPLQHGGCYKLVATYSGPIEWRACRSQPYGADCTPTSADFLWEKEIPAFRGTASVEHLWWAY